MYFRKRQFVRKMFVHNFRAPFPPPHPPSKMMDFLMNFYSKDLKTKLRTLSKNCEQTLQKLRTNRIMNKRAFLIFGFLDIWLKKPKGWRTKMGALVEGEGLVEGAEKAESMPFRGERPF